MISNFDGVSCNQHFYWDLYKITLINILLKVAVSYFWNWESKKRYHSFISLKILSVPRSQSSLKNYPHLWILKNMFHHKNLLSKWFLSHRLLINSVAWGLSRSPSQFWCFSILTTCPPLPPRQFVWAFRKCNSWSDGSIGFYSFPLTLSICWPIFFILFTKSTTPFHAFWWWWYRDEWRWKSLILDKIEWIIQNNLETSVLFNDCL